MASPSISRKGLFFKRKTRVYDISVFTIKSDPSKQTLNYYI